MSAHTQGSGGVFITGASVEIRLRCLAKERDELRQIITDIHKIVREPYFSKRPKLLKMIDIIKAWPQLVTISAVAITWDKECAAIAKAEGK